MANPTNVNWVNPIKNTDGTNITTGEITGSTVGIRDTTAAGSAAGTYPFTSTVSGTVTTALISSVTPPPPQGVVLATAVKTNTATVSSAWSTEATFTLVPPVPNPPTGISVS